MFLLHIVTVDQFGQLSKAPENLPSQRERSFLTNIFGGKAMSGLGV